MTDTLPTVVPPVLEKRYVFSSASIQSAIDRATAALPADHKGALVAYGERKPDGTYDVALVVRPNDTWSVALAAATTTTKQLEAGFAVVYSW